MSNRADTETRSVCRPPLDARSWFALAHSHLKKKEPADAIGCYREVLRLEPDNLVALNNLGWLLHTSAKYDEAVSVLERAVERIPHECTLWRNLGEAYQKSQRYQLARLCFMRALEIAPADSRNHYQLGFFYMETGLPEAALEPFRTAIARDAEYADAYNMLANAHVELNECNSALDLYERAIDLQPGDAGYLVNCAIALRHLGRYSDAEQAFDEALALDPNRVEATFGKGMLALLRGDFSTGWKAYEARKQLLRFRRTDPGGIAEWRGEPLLGKRLLIFAEQGYGDTIQFARCIEALRKDQSPAEIVFCCDSALQSLFEGSLLCTLTCHSTPPEGMDYYVYLLSIPSICMASIAEINQTVPYLSVAASRADAWSRHVGDGARPRIGFAWRGRPTHVNDRNRSCTLEWFMKLIARHPDLTFISLQVGASGAEIRHLGENSRVRDCGLLVKNFGDTAAAMAHLDLVISVDTSIVHLAGALALPVWTLLPFDPDWRWRLGISHSEWYPTMRLFRQDRPGNWTGLLQNVSAALDTEFGA